MFYYICFITLFYVVIVDSGFNINYNSMYIVKCYVTGGNFDYYYTIVSANNDLEIPLSCIYSMSIGFTPSTPTSLMNTLYSGISSSDVSRNYFWTSHLTDVAYSTNKIIIGYFYQLSTCYSSNSFNNAYNVVGIDCTYSSNNQFECAIAIITDNSLISYTQAAGGVLFCTLKNLPSIAVTSNNILSPPTLGVINTYYFYNTNSVLDLTINLGESISLTNSICTTASVDQSESNTLSSSIDISMDLTDQTGTGDVSPVNEQCTISLGIDSTFSSSSTTTVDSTKSQQTIQQTSTTVSLGGTITIPPGCMLNVSVLGIQTIYTYNYILNAKRPYDSLSTTIPIITNSITMTGLEMSTDINCILR